MLKHTMTYKDFNDKEVTKDFYFNISEAKIVELEVEYEGGFGAHLQAIVNAKDVSALIREFKNLLLLAYGEKSADGEYFLQSPEISKKFTQTQAYSDLFMKLATDNEFALEFITKIMPGDLQAKANALAAANVVSSTSSYPPPPPVNS